VTAYALEGRAGERFFDLVPTQNMGTKELGVLFSAAKLREIVLPT
jgi:hypothetical protein